MTQFPSIEWDTGLVTEIDWRFTLHRLETSVCQKCLSLLFPLPASQASPRLDWFFVPQRTELRRRYELQTALFHFRCSSVFLYFVSTAAASPFVFSSVSPQTAELCKCRSLSLRRFTGMFKEAARGGQEEESRNLGPTFSTIPVCRGIPLWTDRSVPPSPLSISVVFFPLLLLPHLVLICLVILGKRGSRSPYRRRAIGIGGGRVTFRSSGHETSFKETCHRLQ